MNPHGNPTHETQNTNLADFCVQETRLENTAAPSGALKGSPLGTMGSGKEKGEKALQL